jgi:cellulose synthase/poly-beta-1,6-N-acetylglucosamine synthase-like glycosyltransferase
MIQYTNLSGKNLSALQKVFLGLGVTFLALFVITFVILPLLIISPFVYLAYKLNLFPNLKPGKYKDVASEGIKVFRKKTKPSKKESVDPDLIQDVEFKTKED